MTVRAPIAPPPSRTSARRRARALAVQGLYGWLVGHGAIAEIEKHLSERSAEWMAEKSAEKSAEKVRRARTATARTLLVPIVIILNGYCVA